MVEEASVEVPGRGASTPTTRHQINLWGCETNSKKTTQYLPLESFFRPSNLCFFCEILASLTSLGFKQSFRSYKVRLKMCYVVFEEDILRGETNHHLLISMSKHTVFLHLCYRVPTKMPPFLHQTVFWALLSQVWCCCVLPLFSLTCSFPRCVCNLGRGLWFLLQQRDSPENHELITSGCNTLVSSPLQSLFIICLVFVFDYVSLFSSQLHLFTWSPSSWPPERSSLPFRAPSFSICLFE